MSKESPIVSFRVPLEVVERLVASGKLKPEHTKSELSNLIKNEWLAGADEEVKLTVDARDVAELHPKLDEVLQLLRGKQQVA